MQYTGATGPDGDGVVRAAARSRSFGWPEPGRVGYCGCRRNLKTAGQGHARDTLPLLSSEGKNGLQIIVYGFGLRPPTSSMCSASLPQEESTL